jgi:hypothetical protein
MDLKLYHGINEADASGVETPMDTCVRGKTRMWKILLHILIILAIS